MLRVRIAPEHDVLIREAADAARLRKGSGDVSSWVRETLVAAARKELKKKGGGTEG
jgi:ribosomal protein L16/L10AE